MYMKYFLGFLVIALGIFMVIKTEWMLQNFGRIDWAEEKFAFSGGSRLMYKLIGLVFIFGTLMFWTGGFQRILLGIFGPTLGG